MEKYPQASFSHLLLWGGQGLGLPHCFHRTQKTAMPPPPIPKTSPESDPPRTSTRPWPQRCMLHAAAACCCCMLLHAAATVAAAAAVAADVAPAPALLLLLLLLLKSLALFAFVLQTTFNFLGMQETGIYRTWPSLYQVPSTTRSVPHRSTHCPTAHSCHRRRRRRLKHCVLARHDLTSVCNHRRRRRRRSRSVGPKTSARAVPTHAIVAGTPRRRRARRRWSSCSTPPARLANQPIPGSANLHPLSVSTERPAKVRGSAAD